MKKDIFLLSLVVVVIFSGCLDTPGGELGYKNDIITIEDYYVSNVEPYPDEVVTIEFLVQNNGEATVPRVEIGFPTHPGFEITELFCEGGSIMDDDACVFDSSTQFGEIESLDSRRVLIELKTIDVKLLDPQSYTTYYYVKYIHTGFKEMNIPIIDGTTITEPQSQYSESSSTYGPIQMSFELVPRGESVVDGRTTKKYWGVGEMPFKVEMHFTHVGSSSIGTISDPRIEAGNVKIDLRNSLTATRPCDFYAEGDDTDSVLISDDDVKIPGELSCNFMSVQFDDPETTATIKAEFDYEYRFGNYEQFEIQAVEGYVGGGTGDDGRDTVIGGSSGRSGIVVGDGRDTLLGE